MTEPGGWPYLPLAQWHEDYAETWSRYPEHAEPHAIVSKLLSAAYAVLVELGRA